MPSLDERESLLPANCRCCKHTWRVATKTSEGDFIGCYCMLDVPEEARNCMENRVPEIFGYIPKLSDFSELFRSLMEREGYPDLDAARYVEDTNCCQFFEGCVDD